MRIDTTTLSRLFRTAVNPYWGTVPKAPQKAVYRFGRADQAGLEGGVPQWIVADAPAVAAGDTIETSLRLPAYFSLLGMIGWSDQETTPITGNLFTVELYDNETELVLIEGSAFNGTLCGFLGTALAELSPYCFKAAEASMQCRLTNLAANPANLEFILYGVTGGDRS